MSDTPSMEEGYSTKKGRSPNEAEIGFDETNSLEDAFDDRGLAEKGIQAVHDLLTSKPSAVGSLGGSVYTGIDFVHNPATFEATASNPEALQVAMTAALAVGAYNVADQAGVQATMKDAVEYVQDRFTSDGYVEIEDLEATGEPVGTPVETMIGPMEDESHYEAQFYDALDELDMDEYVQK